MRSDILGILKNAVDRGEDIHGVGQSLVNAGYPAVEVQDAMSSLAPAGVMSSMSSSVAQQSPVKPVSSQMPSPVQIPKSIVQPNPVTQQQQFRQPSQPLPSVKPQQPQNKGKTKLIFLIIILAVLIASLTVTVIFKDKIVSLFS